MCMEIISHNHNFVLDKIQVSTVFQHVLGLKVNVMSATLWRRLLMIMLTNLIRLSTVNW